MSKKLIWKKSNKPSGSFRVIRGGGWYFVARSLRAGFRYWAVPGNRYEGIGFRCVRLLKDHLIENNKTEESK